MFMTVDDLNKHSIVPQMKTRSHKISAVTICRLSDNLQNF